MHKAKQDEFKRQITLLIARLDICINDQINIILHDSQFQALEASWRSLELLLSRPFKGVIFRILNLSLAELEKNIHYAMDFDQTFLFHKIYHAEYASPGGQPFGLLLGGYYFSNSSSHLDCLYSLMQVCASAFVPFIASVSPHFFGVEHFNELKPQHDLRDIFKSPRWLKLRTQEAARFIGLTLPKILIRSPYNFHESSNSNRFFKENICKHEDYLWGNAAFAYAYIVARAYSQTGWFADLRGFNHSTLSGGLIDIFPRIYPFSQQGFTSKSSTDSLLTDKQEKILQEEGFLPLRDNPVAKTLVFYGADSLWKIPYRRGSIQDANNRIGSMLNYVLCCSRFIHYIKVMMRDKIGKFITPEGCATYLQQWLLQYCSASSNLSVEAMIRYPLNDAKVVVLEHSSMGKYTCIVQLKPHYQLDEIHSHLRLVTQI